MALKPIEFTTTTDNLIFHKTLLIGHGGQDWASGAQVAGYNAYLDFGLVVSIGSQMGMNCSISGTPGGDGDPAQMLYRVHLKQTELWADYAENPDDTLEIEIFEHWLSPV